MKAIVFIIVLHFTLLVAIMFEFANSTEIFNLMIICFFSSQVSQHARYIVGNLLSVTRSIELNRYTMATASEPRLFILRFHGYSSSSKSHLRYVL